MTATLPTLRCWTDCYHVRDVYLSDISPFKLIESETGGKVERCSVVKMSSLSGGTSTEVSCDLCLT